MISDDREYRSFAFEQSESEMKVEGIPIVFGQPTMLFERDGVKYFEVIERGALKEADISDVVLNVNHAGRPAAKTKNGTLNIEVRDEDVFISADLSKSSAGRDLHEEIRNGFLDKMSFAFIVTDQIYDKETRTRRIKKIARLYDVSAVDKPAYEQTSITARSFLEAEAEKEVMEMAELEVRQRKLALKMRVKGD